MAAFTTLQTENARLRAENANNTNKGIEEELAVSPT